MMLGDATVVGILPATDLTRARAFWKGLGLREASMDEQAEEVVFEAGQGTMFVVYARSEPTKAEHTVLGFDVQDLDGTMQDLRGHGVKFEDYDLPNLKTENGVARMGDARGAWFKDSEGNIINVAEGMRARKMAGAGMSSGMQMGGDIGM